MPIGCFAYLLPHKEPPQAALLLSLAGPWAGRAPQGSASSDLTSSLSCCHQTVAGLEPSAGETGPGLGVSLLHVVQESGLSPRHAPGEGDLDFQVVVLSSPKRRIQEGGSGKGGRPDLESAHSCHPTKGRTPQRALTLGDMVHPGHLRTLHSAQAVDERAGCRWLRDFTPDSVTGVLVEKEETQMHMGVYICVHAHAHIHTSKAM